VGEVLDARHERTRRDERARGTTRAQARVRTRRRPREKHGGNPPLLDVNQLPLYCA
jgi:hypothetical protein